MAVANSFVDLDGRCGLFLVRIFFVEVGDGGVVGDDSIIVVVVVSIVLIITSYHTM